MKQYKDNMRDAVNKGRTNKGKDNPSISGIMNGKASLTTRKIRRLVRLKGTKTQSYIARRLSVSQPTISHFINRKSYTV